MNYKLALACIPALTIALAGNLSVSHAAQPAKLTACSLLPDGDIKEFAMGKGNSKVELTVFHDKRPNLDVAKELAEKVFKRLR